MNTLAAITAEKAGFKSLGDAWADTTTSHGRLMLTVLAGLAEFERDLIRARTGEGRERAVARGQRMGRPPKLTPHQKREAIKRRDTGEESLAEIGRSYNVSADDFEDVPMNSDLSEPLPHRDRIRRVALLCCAFARNVAFHRAAWADEAQPLLSTYHPKASFWRQVNGNFFDMAVLDWCKLFGDQKETPPKRLGKHHWRRVVSDPNEFEARLLGQLETDAERFAALISNLRDYRDTFVAHLDNGLTMNLPEFEAARVAVTFYYRHIVETEAEPGDLAGLPSVDEFARGDGQCTQEAAQVYRIHLQAE